jgi:hypothetical protein
VESVQHTLYRLVEQEDQRRRGHRDDRVDRDDGDSDEDADGQNASMGDAPRR